MVDYALAVGDDLALPQGAAVAVGDGGREGAIAECRESLNASSPFSLVGSLSTEELSKAATENPSLFPRAVPISVILEPSSTEDSILTVRWGKGLG